MSEQAEQLKARTKQFAVRIFALVQSLPRRPRSHAEFVAKLGVVIEEADETVFWLELLVDTKTVPRGGYVTCWRKPTS
jgi:hypothetical protein